MRSACIPLLPLCFAALLLAPAPAQAQEAEPWSELVALGAAARDAWPALAELVDEARSSDAQDPSLRMARYGRHHPRRKQALRDWEALGQALDALEFLQRVAERRERLSVVYRGAQHQALQELRAGLRDATPDELDPPEVTEPWITGRSWAETLAAVDKRETRAYGALRPTLLILHELRRAEPAAEPVLADEAYLEALAAAGRAQLYTVEGSDAAGKPYAGRAAVSFHDGQLSLWRAAGGRVLAGELDSDGEGGWTVEGEWLSQTGLADLGVAAEGEARFVARYVPEGEGLRGAWRAVDREQRVLAEGSERLEPVALDGTQSEVPAILGMSPLMAKVVAAALPCAEKGTVPRRLMLTTRNTTTKRALLTGPEIFAEYERLIAGAEREVLVQTFVWENESQAAQRALAGLRALEQRMTPGQPARVRFMRSKHRFAMGGFKAVEDMIEQLEGAGLDPERVELDVRGYGHAFLDNLHAKVLVVDGLRAVLTGANFEVCHDAGEPWFDAGFGIAGDVAHALRHEYVQGWHKATGEWLPALERVPAEGSIPMLLATSRGRGAPWTNASDDPQAAAFAAAIDGAREVVRIQTPNLNDDVIKDALVAAVLRGTRAEVIVSHTFNETGENLPGRGGGNAKNVDALYRRVLEEGGPEAAARLDVRWYAAADGTVIVGNGPLASHAKYATFDHQLAIVGSGNLDTTSINNSREVNVVVDDAETVRAWDGRLFEPNFARAGRARPVLVDQPLGQ